VLVWCKGVGLMVSRVFFKSCVGDVVETTEV
jgi:hypothetical protein